MTVRARFDGKAFVPEEPVNLPCGTPVTIVVVAGGAQPLQALAALAVEAPITDSPSDWSERHDDYVRRRRSDDLP